MTYTPGRLATLPMVSTFTPSVSVVGRWGLSPASFAYESANRAVYYPIVLLNVHVVRRLWWGNGATVSGANTIDVGIYADAAFQPGAKLVSTTATAQGTTVNIQFVDVTDTTLAPGRYWLAINCSATSSDLLGVTPNTSTYPNAQVRYQETLGDGTLPSTATPVETTNSQVYFFGFATTASP